MLELLSCFAVMSLVGLSRWASHSYHRRRVQVPYSGFGMATRSIWCIIISRAIRTVAFMLTVLPSQRPGCYGRRFPPVPDTWREFLAIGFGRLRASGGCNDLIISGAVSVN